MQLPLFSMTFPTMCSFNMPMNLVQSVHLLKQVPISTSNSFSPICFIFVGTSA